MNLREKCIKVFTFFQENNEAGLRKAAAETGISKSSADRHKKAVERRNQHPESLMWETEAGQRWLTVLVCATLYIFGIRCG
ncbi:MAG: DNA-binding protein, partial [Desulfobacteraceae bacterium]|nr:DNA-binding protein [Desulfobacteraceae bacterium]